MKRHVRFSVGLIFFAFAFLAALYTQRVRVSDLAAELSAPSLPEAVKYDGTEGADGTEEAEDEVLVLGSWNFLSESSVPSAFSVPDEFNLDVPFTSQAPFAVWDEVHQETCEEASAYMVAAYYAGVTGRIDPETADKELLRLVALERERFGYFEDTTAAETAALIADAYGLRAEVELDPTADDIRAHVAAGRPVIVPAAGRLLGNPNFTGEGPPYHMLVIRGYVGDRFVANDPGTRRGEAYVYSEAVIMNAIHDWTGSLDTIESGQKAVLVVYP
jgi:hypothetical protein